MCERMKSFQVVVWLRLGAGAIPCRRETLPMVWSETHGRIGECTNNPVICPAGVLSRHLNNKSFSLATRRIRVPMLLYGGGTWLPEWRRMVCGFEDFRNAVADS
jgi:hypothetical protein